MNEIFGPINYFFEQLLLSFLPFWKEFFILIAAVAWPASLLLIAYWFKGSIAEVIKRLSNVEVGNLKLGLQHPQQQSLEKNEELKTRLQSIAKNGLDPNVLSQFEKSISDDLKKLNDSDRLPWLVTSLAQAIAEKIFAIAYANIFGSQIIALKELNTRGPHVIEAAEKYFQELRERDPLFSDWNLGHYLHFLKVFNFIEEKDSTYSITAFGKEFLLFLTRYQLSEQRQH